MSGTTTLSPTCSLDIRIFTPATSPVTRKSSTADTLKATTTLTLREQYQVQGSTSDDHTTLEDGDVKFVSTKQSLTAITRPKLALDIPLAISTFQGPEQGETTTPPPSPPSGSTTSTSERTCLRNPKHTLPSLTGTSRRPKLALNIPTHASGEIRSPRSVDAGETTTPPLSPHYHPPTAKKDNLSPHGEGDFKLTRRSLTEGPRRKPTLQNLHPYIQAIIVHYLASDDWFDKYSLRVTCRRFYSLIGPPRPYLDRYPQHRRGSLLSCRDCLRLRNRAEFVDYMRSEEFQSGGRGARQRYCVDCGLKERIFEGRRIPPRFKKRTRLSVDGVEFVVCWYCGEFERAPGREETHFMDCCRKCLVDGSRWMSQLKDGGEQKKVNPKEGLDKVLDG